MARDAAAATAAAAAAAVSHAARLRLLLLVVLAAAQVQIARAAASVQFTNPPPDKRAVYYENDLLDITWDASETVWQYTLVLQQYDGRKVAGQDFLMLKNGSIGPVTTQYVWPIDLSALVDNNRKSIFALDKEGEESFKIAMWRDLRGRTRLAETGFFSLQATPDDHDRRLYTAGRSINLDAASRGGTGLSTGAKAGLGVGVALGVVLVAINLAWVILWAKRQKKAKAAAEEAKRRHEEQQQQQQL
ncbi:hypothetical protein KEM52_006193, partial [Ascosphaera acerosa]